MRPVDSSVSDSDSSDEDRSLSRARSLSSTTTPSHRQPRTLQLLRVLKTSKSSCQSFLVRSLRTEQPNLVSEMDSISTTQGISTGEPSRASNEEVENGLREEKGLRVAKVFDQNDIESLSKLNQVLLMRQKLVGRKLAITRCSGISENSEDSVFTDNEGQIYHYPKGYCMYTEEYCEQGDLLKLTIENSRFVGIQQQQDQQSLIRKVFILLLKTLSTLHQEQQICLLNLSLTKVLIDKHLNPKFYDLSKAQSLKETISPLQLLKDRESNLDRIYLAPEALCSNPQLPLNGEKLDIFALGVMLFSAIFKQPPFKVASNTDPLYKQLSSKNSNHQQLFFKSHPALKGQSIDADLKDLLIKMLSLDPSSRPNAEEILQNPWFSKGSNEMTTSSNDCQIKSENISTNDSNQVKCK